MEPPDTAQIRFARLSDPVQSSGRYHRPRGMSLRGASERLQTDARLPQAKGIFPKQHKEQEENVKQNPQVGTLRTMTQLIIDLVQVRTHAIVFRHR